jgi:ribosomal protein S18 acetylase RimI-like enzyme
VAGNPVITIRDAIARDVPGIATVHVQAWRETYAPFLAGEALAGLSVEDRARLWRSTFSDPDRRARLLVAEQGGRIVGFCRGGAVRSGDGVPLGTEAEIYAIYLLDAVKRRGLGRCLLLGVFDHLAAGGFASVGLWVLRDNAPARRFYEAMGGVSGGEQSFEIAGQTVVETAYRFEPMPRGPTSPPIAG